MKVGKGVRCGVFLCGICAVISLESETSALLIARTHLTFIHSLWLIRGEGEKWTQFSLYSESTPITHYPTPQPSTPLFIDAGSCHSHAITKA